MSAWTVIVLACLLPSALATTYCTAVRTTLNVSDGDSGALLGVLNTDVEFDSPRPNYSRFRIANLSQSNVDPSFSFGKLEYTDLDGNYVGISGIGGSGLIVSSYTEFDVEVTVNDTTLPLSTIAFTMLYHGTIFDVDAWDLIQSSPCLTFYEFAFDGDVVLSTVASTCCTRFRTIAPPAVNSTCTQLQGNATFHNGNTPLAVVNITADIDATSNVTFSGSSLLVPDANLSQSLAAQNSINFFYSVAYPLPLSPEGSQVYLATEIYTQDGTVGLVSSLGYFEYFDGIVTGFDGHRLTEREPCVRQHLPYLPLEGNSIYTRATSESHLCCTKFGSVQSTKDLPMREIKPRQKYKRHSILKRNMKAQ